MQFYPLLLYVDLLMMLVMTSFLFAAWHFNRDSKGVREWLLGFALASINLLIFVSVPPIPVALFSLLLDALLMSAGLCGFLGAINYIGRPLRYFFPLLIIGACLIVSAVALLKNQDGTTGFTLSSIVSGGYCAIAGVLLMRGGPSNHPFRYLLAGSVLFHGVFIMARPLLFTDSLQLFLDLTVQIAAMDLMVFEQIIMSPILAMSVLLLINEDKSMLLRMRAEFDFLTGVRNRGSFFEQLAKAASLSSRLNAPLSVMVIDLDHFKSINDRYGHQAGDEILKDFVKVAKSCIRNEDDVGRIGGEEFGIFLMNTPLNQAMLIAERLRASAESSAVVFGNATISYTASIGLAAYEEQFDVTRAVDRADQALYFAKNRGRNCVEPRLPEGDPLISGVI
jgi:diguanylate cyclase (GGDEF)-like protein